MLMMMHENRLTADASKISPHLRDGPPLRAMTILLAALALIGCSGREEKTVFYPNRQVRERWHDRSVGPTRVVKDGTYEAFYPDGARQAAGTYDNGDSVGLWQEWYLNGGYKSEKSFGEHGKLKGRSIVWMPGGDTLEFKTFNDLGELDGRYATFWRDNGELREQGEFSHGKRHGIWMRWSHNGAIEYGREYDDGRPVGRWVEFGSDGHVASIIEYRRTLPPELAQVWSEALVDGVPVGKSFIYQRHERKVDTVAVDQREYGELQKKGPDWIVPFTWRSPRFGAIEKQRMDTLIIWRHHEGANSF
jgi:antitoxin component YwqK of YwqJK toxin-antitoxin module